MKLLYIFLIPIIFFAACNSNDFKVMQSSGNNPGVILELKMRRGTFGAGGDFEIKLINSSSADLQNCKLEFNDKYSYTINGLHIKEKGIYKSDIFPKADTLTIPFIEGVNNLIFFKVPDEGFKPEKIRLICNECDAVWKVE